MQLNCTHFPLQGRANTYLFIGEHEERGLGQLVVRQDLVELLPDDGQPLLVRRVHHQDHKLPQQTGVSRTEVQSWAKESGTTRPQFRP